MSDHRLASVFEYPAFARGSKDLDTNVEAAARGATVIVGGVIPRPSSLTTTPRTSLAMSPLTVV